MSKHSWSVMTYLEPYEMRNAIREKHSLKELSTLSYIEMPPSQKWKTPPRTWLFNSFCINITGGSEFKAQPCSRKQIDNSTAFKPMHHSYKKLNELHLSGCQGLLYDFVTPQCHSSSGCVWIGPYAQAPLHICLLNEICFASCAPTMTCLLSFQHCLVLDHKHFTS